MPLRYEERSIAGTLVEADRLDLAADDVIELLASSHNIGVWRLNIETNEYLLSAPCLAIFGFEKQDGMPGLLNFRSKIHPDDIPIVLEGIDACIQRQGSYMVTYRVQASGGHKFVRTIGRYRETAEGPELIGLTFELIDRLRELVVGD